MDHITKSKRWVQGSFEGGDGKASSRKLTAFIGMLMFVTTWAAELFFGLTTSDIITISVVCIVLIGFGFMTAQNIVDILKRPQNSYYDNEIYNPLNRDSGNTDDAPME